MGDEDVRFGSDGCTLAGTFTNVTSPVAATLIITGSGKINRDGDARLIRTGVTRAFAEALSGARVATLRYDKRGVGASGAVTRSLAPSSPGTAHLTHHTIPHRHHRPGFAAARA